MRWAIADLEASIKELRRSAVSSEGIAEANSSSRRARVALIADKRRF